MRPQLLVPLLFVACSAQPAPFPPPRPAPPNVDSSTKASAPADTAWPAPAPASGDGKQTLGSGSVFAVPPGWSVALHGNEALVVAPEPDLKIAIVDAGAATPEEAVRAAWAIVHPGFARTLKVAQTMPGRRGWDERRIHEYETSPNEKLFVLAAALRRGDKWAALAVESSMATVERRAAPMRKVFDTFVPAGAKRESFAGKKAHPLDDARIKSILDSADKAREAAGIPGEGIALVQNGKVVYEGGLGVRTLGKPDKVTAHTAFMIASNTKSLTTLLLAKLVDEKKLKWDEPVVDAYPDFKLGDPDTTKKVLISHLVCACTGMPRQDMEWLFQFPSQSPKTSMELLGTMKPTTKFGETFQYSNLMASAAGYIAGAVLQPKKELGAAYDDAMQTRVFAPLGMSETTFDWNKAMKAEHAMGHALDVDGKPAGAVMELNRAVHPHRPAGGAWSTAHDLAKYVLMELARGLLPDGKRYISEDALLARRKSQVALGEYSSYGMGLFVDHEFGVDVVHHGGDIFGYHSDMFWIPAADTGGVILGNGDAYLVRKAFIRKVLEVLYDGTPEADEDVQSQIASFREDLAVERKRLTIPADPEIVKQLAPKYTSSALGTVTVKSDAKGAVFELAGWKSPVASRKNADGTVSLITYAAGGAEVPFVVGNKDGKRTLTVRDAQHEYVFVESAK